MAYIDQVVMWLAFHSEWANLIEAKECARY